MISRFFLSLFFLIQTSVALKLSDDFLPFIIPHSSSSSSSSLSVESYNSSFVAPLGWIQGIVYNNPTCSGDSFVTTNIALGVCVQDGDSSSYMQYMLINPDTNPTTYEFYMNTFSDSTCSNMITHHDLGTLDPAFVCLQDNGSNDGFSKTVYYYPGETPPLYPYDGVLTNYISNNDTCTGTLLKTVILNPSTCYINYMYNSSDVNSNFQRFTTQCNEEYPVFHTIYSDAYCTVPVSVNNTLYHNAVCQPAALFRQQNGLPEMYLLDSETQFNYETAVATCYTGPTVFVLHRFISEIYRKLEECFYDVNNFLHFFIEMVR